MTIGQSIKIAINSAFVNTTFRGRDAITIRNMLNTKVYGSNNMLVMIPVPDVSDPLPADKSYLLKLLTFYILPEVPAL